MGKSRAVFGTVRGDRVFASRPDRQGPRSRVVLVGVAGTGAGGASMKGGSRRVLAW